jgi:hypothetical protein
MVRPEIAIKPNTYRAIKDEARSEDKEIREFLGELLLIGWQYRQRIGGAVTSGAGRN